MEENIEEDYEIYEDDYEESMTSQITSKPEVKKPQINKVNKPQSAKPNNVIKTQIKKQAQIPKKKPLIDKKSNANTLYLQTQAKMKKRQEQFYTKEQYINISIK